jgi:hypothetical protein
VKAVSEEIGRTQTSDGEHVIYVDESGVHIRLPDGTVIDLTASQARAFGDQMLAAANDPTADEVRVDYENRTARPGRNDASDDR